MRLDKGLLECDFGEWTGEQLRALMKRPEWRTVSNPPLASGEWTRVRLGTPAFRAGG